MDASRMERLEAILSIANLVPDPKTVVLSVHDFLRRAREEYNPTADSPPVLTEIYRRWFASLAQFEDLYDYLGLSNFDYQAASESDLEGREYWVEKKFREFEGARWLVKVLVDIGEDMQKRGEEWNASAWESELNQKIGGVFVSLHVGRSPKDPDYGRVRFVKDPVLETLEGLDVTKFKRCSACQRVFWQNRKDKKNCSKKCSNVTAQRQLRQFFERKEGGDGRK